MNFLEIILFLASIPGYIVDIVQLLELVVSYFKNKEKAKALADKTSATNTREV